MQSFFLPHPTLRTLFALPASPLPARAGLFFLIFVFHLRRASPTSLANQYWSGEAGFPDFRHGKLFSSAQFSERTITIEGLHPDNAIVMMRL
jgi:hypothetical protein